MLHIEFLLYLDYIGASLNWLTSFLHKKIILNLDYVAISENVDKKIISEIL